MHYGKAEPEECLQSITSSKKSPRKLLATQPSSITYVWDRNSSASIGIGPSFYRRTY